MWSRIAFAGMLLAGVQISSAADPLIPPAPVAPPAGIQHSVPRAGTVPLPPAPGLNSNPIEPIPDAAPAGNSIPQSPSPAQGASPVQNASPAHAIPQAAPAASPAVLSPATAGPAVNQGSIVVPQGTYPSYPTPYGTVIGSPYENPANPYGSGYPAYGMPGYPGEIAPQYNSFASPLDPQQRYVSGPGGSEHARYPYYSYRRPWYSPGPVSRNVNIIW